jgi:hypothetical protein
VRVSQPPNTTACREAYAAVSPSPPTPSLSPRPSLSLNPKPICREAYEAVETCWEAITHARRPLPAAREEFVGRLRQQAEIARLLNISAAPPSATALTSLPLSISAATKHSLASSISIVSEAGGGQEAGRARWRVGAGEAEAGAVGVEAENSQASVVPQQGLQHELQREGGADAERAAFEQLLAACVSDGSLHPIDHDAFRAELAQVTSRVKLGIEIPRGLGTNFHSTTLQLKAILVAPAGAAEVEASRESVGEQGEDGEA